VKINVTVGVNFKTIIMTSRDFAFWLQGFFEVANPSTIGTKETDIIKKHLNLVFKHEIDPSMGDAEHQDELNQIHSPQSFPMKGEDGAVLRC
jgi:hypothetical protein